MYKNKKLNETQRRSPDDRTENTDQDTRLHSSTTKPSATRSSSSGLVIPVLGLHVGLVFNLVAVL